MRKVFLAMAVILVLALAALSLAPNPVQEPKDAARSVYMEIVAVLTHYSGLNALRMHWHHPAVHILAYHGIEDSPPPDNSYFVSTARFAEQMAFLKAHYEVISFSELFRLREKPGKQGEGAYVIITFDDGYRNNFINAVPILNKLNLKACFFLTTGLLDYVPGDDVHKMAREWRYPGLAWDEVKSMQKMGFEIGAHTLSHPNLRKLPLAQARREIVGSKEELEKRLGIEVRHFAYPYGQKDKNYNDAVRDIVARNFTTGSTTIWGENSLRDLNLPELRRFTVHNFWSLSIFERVLEGSFDPFISQHGVPAEVAGLAAARGPVPPPLEILCSAAPGGILPRVTLTAGE